MSNNIYRNYFFGRLSKDDTEKFEDIINEPEVEQEFHQEQSLIIKDFLQKKLNTVENNFVKNKINTDQDFKMEVDEISRLLQIPIQGAKRALAKKKSEDATADLKNKTEEQPSDVDELGGKVVPFWRRTVVRIAVAAAAILLIILFYPRESESVSTPTELIVANYKPVYGDHAGTKDMIQEVSSLIRAGKFEEAEEMLNGNSSADAEYLRGVKALKSGAYEEALPKFDFIIDIIANEKYTEFDLHKGFRKEANLRWHRLLLLNVLQDYENPHFLEDYTYLIKEEYYKERVIKLKKSALKASNDSLIISNLPEK